MRKLKRTLSVSWHDFAFYVSPFIHNTSTKPHARLLNSLAAIIYGQEQPSPYRAVPHQGPNRAERRAKLFLAHVPAPISHRVRRALAFGHKVVDVAPGAPNPQPLEPRKITGAVRRGLERGREA